MTKKTSSTKSSSKKNSDDTVLTKTDVKNIKTAYKNAKQYKILFAIFAIIAVIALCTLPFANTLEPMVNNWLNSSTTTPTEEVSGDGVTVSSVCLNSKLKVHYVFVGQGDCILIDLPDGKNMIIDSGSDTYDSDTSTKVINYIRQNLLGEGEIIDYMVLTHPDSDHVYYLPDVLDEFEVATIYRPYTFFVSNGKDSTQRLDPDNTIATIAEKEAIEQKERNAVSNLNSEYGYGITIGDYTKSTTNAKATDIMYKFISRVYAETYGASNTPATMKFPIAGEKIIGADYTFTFYSPVTPSKVYSSWNDYSSVIVLEYNGKRIAFTGDAEKVEENEILANTSLTLPDVDIMDMGHHGSKTSSQDKFVKALKPEYAIISCGIDNKYNHPNQETLDTLHNNGVDDNHIFITAQSGDIVIGFDYTAPVSGETVSADANETKNIVIAYSGDKEYVPVTPVHIEWWYVVVAIIVLAGLILLVIVPSILKAIKRASK